ncbi:MULTISPECIES: glycogen/starch/alpha-glucan phosphorylase [Clostridia]|jgi:starch phosphorylase|uniref:Alpha-1,4 glucan phosphorylase n=1 Tax=Butyribacter intestini TaxID=1703332 RepID=A0AAW3JUA1_9FIRM|nr:MULTISPECIES: glycogen/starch/alpha-glucan phosphorylase [Clostridia]KQC85970.1 maltose phosphorylase [Butyribacter intestini]RHT93500.1 glycogen/starch/alpha-glucan family phosphorylase [Clostridium sp. AM27-31LB]RHU77075.1 glycogen/starch/alpha-glucan family phosphorylase [Butyribacter intestini]
MYENEIENIASRGTNEEIYYGLLELTKNAMQQRGKIEGKKKLYYISAEFLIGKLLSNNLINLGLYDQVEDALKKHGKSMAEIEEIEPEPSLGNGGLGRLAACFLDSIATLGLNGDGVGINYHLGLFKQEFDKNLQKEVPNPWIKDKSWLRRTDTSYEVIFGGLRVNSVMYEIDVTGYDNKCNTLKLFDIDSVDENIVQGESIYFNKEDIRKNLTLFLYPDDSDYQGQLLRIYQQYFMVSNAAQLIIDEAAAKGSNLYDLADYAVVQINDTHPTMVIPELIRLLVKKGIDMDKAIDIVSSMCAYTNHTILAEALEKWPVWFLDKVVPQLMPIIKMLDVKVKEKYNNNPELAIIDENQQVHMARIDMHYGFSVNGVAALHTEILKNSELKPFYDIYPNKFNNKTNGITFRRWLLHSNHELTGLISSKIGDGFKKDANELEKLMQFKDDEAVLKAITDIKMTKKKEFKDYLLKKENIEIDENSIIDVQVKRLHEYKRQQMNALYIIHKYMDIKAGNKPARPITFVFGAKAAPAYTIAKDIIHLILCLSKVIENDPEVSPYLKVVMLENYNVTYAEKIIPAADISEQISLASKEASGTSNMKFMLNGAVTLGTEDGANVEIHELVGDDNIYIFGEKSDTVIEHYAKADYSAEKIYDEDPEIAKLVDFIIDKKMFAVGNKKSLIRLYMEIVTKDWFMTLLDIKDYIRVKEQVFKDYEDRAAWSRKMIKNIAMAGFFSSDRTIAQYNDDIWHLD